ncbi:MAG: M28 family peptidase [Ignavibacteriae bacterium]|nr:M28 family peptidase [Ignavibacteriota bacterium]
MRRAFRLSLTFCLMIIAITKTFSQEAEDRTLLSHEQMRAIINEASGERAMHHVLELVPYPRVRPKSEYEGHFRESEVMAKYAKEYGFSNVEIESFPAQNRLWQPSQGELWMVEPVVKKLYDIYDVAISLAGNSLSGDVTAEVVDVGIGAREEDYARKDVKGKLVLGSTSPNTLQRLGVFDRSAAGVVSYTSLRADSYPDEILSSGISANAPEGKEAGFGWVIAPRVAREIVGYLGRGQKVVLRSIIKAETFPGELETVHATIPGDGSSDQVVMVSAHLYEGYIKQGANDDNSGCAVTLEMGRAYIRLVKEGKLPPPKRAIHFLWVPEISGTNAWLNAHKDIEAKAIADLNFDMEGLRLSTSSSFWILQRTPDTFPSYLNDICASFMEFVAETNRERVRYRANGYRPSLPVHAPNGSQDAFYIKIDKHYGSSDHVTYMQHGIPAVMFVTWPDMWYHSSQDTPDKLDPTQFKRVAVVGIGAFSAIASADDAMAMRVAGESFTRGSERMGAAQRKGFSYMTDIADGSQLSHSYKEAQNAVRHQAEVEKGVIRSASVLFAKPSDAQKKLASFESLIDKRATTLQNEVDAFYRMQAEIRKTSVAKIAMSSEEKEAGKVIVERVQTQGGGGGFGGQQAAIARANLTDVERATLNIIPQHMRAELNILLGQNKSILEIRDFLSGEFEPLPLADLTAYLRTMAKVGTVKLTAK